MKLTAEQSGAALMTLGVFCLASMDVMVKALGPNFPVVQMVWLRFTSQALLVGVGLALIRRPLFESRHLPLHALRGLATITSGFFFFVGITYLPLADATALIQLGPVMVTLGAVLVLGERIGRRRILSVFATFIGAILIIRPGTSVMTTMALFPLLGVIFFTVYALATRLTRNDNPWVSLFLQGLFGACFSSFAIPFFWEPVDLSEVPTLAAFVLFGTAGHLFMIRAFAIAPASHIAPFGYMGLLFAIIFGFTIFGEIPDLITLVGASIIVVAGLYVCQREQLVKNQ